MGEPAEGTRSREVSEAGPDGTAPGQEEGTRWTVPSCRITRNFGSLLIAGCLRRGAPVGHGVVGGQGDQGTMTLGLSERLKLLGEHATPAGTQEGRQAPAQSLGRLLPGVILEELAHGVSGEVVLKGGEGPVRGRPAHGGPAGARRSPPVGDWPHPQHGGPCCVPWSPGSKATPLHPDTSPLSPEARSEGSTRPSRTWRGWRSRSPEGPGHSCGSSTLPRCHGCCGGSRGLPACLEVPQGEGEPHVSTGPHGPPRTGFWPVAAPGAGAGEEENHLVGGGPAGAASLVKEGGESGQAGCPGRTGVEACSRTSPWPLGASLLAWKVDTASGCHCPGRWGKCAGGSLARGRPGGVQPPRWGAQGPLLKARLGRKCHP